MEAEWRQNACSRKPRGVGGIFGSCLCFGQAPVTRTPVDPKDEPKALGPATQKTTEETAEAVKTPASVGAIRILRKGKVIYFNYNDVSNGNNVSQNITVENNDHMFVQ